MRTFLFLFCVTVSLSSIAGSWHTVKGNGVFKNETREAAGYTSLASGGMMNVEITYGDSKTIRLEGEENLLPYIETEVNGKMLTIKIKDGYTLKTTQPIKIYVSMATVNAIAQSGSGGITGNGEFNSDDDVTVAMSGSGSISMNFGSLPSLSLRMSGSGNISLSGKVRNEVNIKQSGSGNANLDNLSCNNATVQLSGSGNLRIHAEKALTAHISGSGNVVYSGDASVASKVSGSGKVRKA